MFRWFADLFSNNDSIDCMIPTPIQIIQSNWHSIIYYECGDLPSVKSGSFEMPDLADIYHTTEKGFYEASMSFRAFNSQFKTYFSVDGYAGGFTAEWKRYTPQQLNQIFNYPVIRKVPQSYKNEPIPEMKSLIQPQLCKCITCRTVSKFPPQEVDRKSQLEKLVLDEIQVNSICNIIIEYIPNVDFNNSWYLSVECASRMVGGSGKRFQVSIYGWRLVQCATDQVADNGE